MAPDSEETFKFVIFFPQLYITLYIVSSIRIASSGGDSDGMPQCIVSWNGIAHLEYSSGSHVTCPSIKLCKCKCIKNQILADSYFSALCLKGRFLSEQ